MSEGPARHRASSSPRRGDGGSDALSSGEAAGADVRRVENDAVGDRHTERVLIGRLGAYTLHSKYDSRELTRAARAAFELKLEREVDPEGVLPRDERLRRADMSRRARFTRLALASVKARRMRQRSPK